MTHPTMPGAPKRSEGGPFTLPKTVDSELAEVLAYWRSLIRGQASDMPFWDDVKLSALPKIEPRLFLLGAQDRPERFRFEIVGKEIVRHQGRDVSGKFADEIEQGAPFDFIRAQASATVEGEAPTYYKHGAYARLLLPLWGDGRIGMLLGATVWL